LEILQELTRNKRGLESDKLLFETIKDYPGLSQYELAKKLEWESGRVDGAIRRLLNENLILIKSIERNGRLVKTSFT
jgi:predicted transcriptional regulator